MNEIFIFFIGLFSGFLGSTVGGGGIFSIPALIFLGYSPQSAIALNKVGDVGTFISAIQRYWQSKRIDWNLAIVITAIYAVGSVMGTQVMVNVNTQTLEILIFISVLLALPLSFLKKDLGLKNLKTNFAKKSIGFITLFALSIIGAVVGAGGAILSTLVMMYFFGYKIIDGHATTTPSKFFSASIPSLIYYSYGFIELIPGVLIFTGMLIGGYVGAKTAIKTGNRRIKALFTAVMLIFIIKLVADLLLT